jgi:hypothetical protein
MPGIILDDFRHQPLTEKPEAASASITQRLTPEVYLASIVHRSVM